MAYDEKTRENIYRYREKHRELIKEQNRKDSKKYYEKHREQILERRRLRKTQNNAEIAV